MMKQSMTCDVFGERLMAYLEHETDEGTRAGIEQHAVTCDECGPLLADLRKLRIDAANLPELTPSRDLWAGIAARIEAPVVSIGTGQPTWVSRSRTGWLRGAMLAASLLVAAVLGYAARGGAPVPATGVEPVAERSVPLASTERAPDSTPSVTLDAAVGAAPARAPQRVAAAIGTPVRTVSTVPTGEPVRSVEVQLAVATLTADYDREIARLRALIEQRRNQLDPVTVAIIEKNLFVIDSAIADSRRAIADDPSSRFLIEFLNQSLRSKVELMRTVALLPSRT
ncbi:MAG: zf-HC2 domain-containing protein [Gemmatimonadaceae bacterium]